MPRILKDSDLHDLIRLYQAGASTKELGLKFGIKSNSVHARLKKAGVTTRSSAEVKAAHLPPIDVSGLVTRYQEGASVNALAKAFGVSRSVISLRLLTAGVKLRDQSESEQLKWSLMDPIQRAAQTAAAHKASAIKFRGVKPSAGAMIAKSAMWERTKFMTKSEATVSAILKDIGIPHTPQKVVGTYNIDLAVDELPIAVEVCWSHPGATYGPKLRRKIEHLLDRGWLVVFIWMLSGNTLNLGRINEHMPAWLDRARRDKSVFGRYGVIRCDRKTGPILREYLDGLPMVEGP